jgi:hypothetical protein
MRTKMSLAARATVLALAAGAAAPGAAVAQVVFYQENFDSAVRNQLSGDPRVINACSGNTPSFTHNPPAGWTWTGCGVKSFECRVGGCTPPPNCATCGNNEGVFEWEGWSFANKDFWVRVAGDQGRAQFTKGVGNVAVADPDEWDDRGNPDVNCGFYNATMFSRVVNLVGVDAASVAFQFDSSWRPEGFDDGNGTNNQTASIRVIYTVGGVEQAPVEVLRWDSDDGINSGNGSPSPFFKPDATNETVVLNASQLNIPVGATAARIEFGLLNAGNDWWWAIDNLSMSGNIGGTPTVIFAEDFEGVTLQPPVHEIPSGCGTTYCNQFTYTRNGPNGVSVFVDPNVTGGVPDWRGWSFVERPFWLCASGGPNGANFTNSSGLVAVADGDEFDDLSNDPGPLDTTLSTPAINISARARNLVVLSFDSSWRPEDPQFATVVAEYNTGEQVEVIRWESGNTQFFKAAAENELVAIPLVVPAAATSVVIKFRYNGFNNWWWAIDNIRVFEGEASVTVASVNPTQTPMIIAPSVDYAPCFTPWSPTVAAGWTQQFNPVNGCPPQCGRDEWRGWAVGAKDWWWQQVDDQLRSEFTLGTGYVAIADPDEWDDFANGQTQFNAFMTTPSITLPNSISSVSLNFNSSWRYEGFDDTTAGDPPGTFTNNQTAMIKAIYTVGGVEQPAVTVLHWDSDDGVNSGNGTPSAFFKPDNTNEAVTIPASALAIPVGAQSVRFEFSMTKARNDWWWAIDNVAFNVNGSAIFTENFENAPDLQAPPTENPPVSQCRYFSSVGAQGGNFTVDNAGLTNCGAPGTDFFGFNAWLVDAWARSEGGIRSQHGATTAFVSDFAARGCDGLARLISPNYSIAGINANTLKLNFRSGWLNEAGHVSTIDVSYNNGTTWTQVLAWTDSNKTTNADENVVVDLNNAEGASTVRVRFNDAESGWWALSNISITGIVGTPACRADFNNDNTVDFFDYLDFVAAFAAEEPSSDINGDGTVDFFDYLDFVQSFSAGC